MYSTPDFLYNGLPIGTAESDCARRINDVRSDVASFRQAVVDTTPSSAPSGMPTKAPSPSPSNAPSGTPTIKPTDGPTMMPSSSPTRPKVPTAAPTTGNPSSSPTQNPTASPTTSSPTTSPSSFPSKAPSKAPTSSPSSSPSTSAPTVTHSTAPTSSPSHFPTTSPSSADCVGAPAHVCGYSLDNNGNAVNGFYSVCIYEMDKQRYQSDCLPKDDLIGLNSGDFLNEDDEIHSCGCCDVSMEHKGETPEHCTGLDVPLSQSDLEQYHCDEDKNGKLRVEFCQYDTSKGQEKEKCKDPFDLDIKEEDDFLNWGECA